MELHLYLHNPDIPLPHVIYPDKGVVINGDCTDPVWGLANIKDAVVQLLTADPPYGMTGEVWDKVLSTLWMKEQFFRVIDPEGVITITGSDSFIHDLTREFSILPNGCALKSKKEFHFERDLRQLLHDVKARSDDAVIKGRIAEMLQHIPTEQTLKYYIIWNKLSQFGNVMHSKNRPKTAHEYIAVFSKGAIRHKSVDEKRTTDGGDENDFSRPRMRFSPYGATFKGTVEHYNKGKSTYLGCKRSGSAPVDMYENTPLSVIPAAKDTDRHVKTENSTAKPSKLLEQLIGMYSDEGGLVVDPTAGSGTAAKAAMTLRRRFIVWERDPLQYAGIVEWLGVSGRPLMTPTPEALTFKGYGRRSVPSNDPNVKDGSSPYDDNA